MLVRGPAEGKMAEQAEAAVVAVVACAGRGMSSEGLRFNLCRRSVRLRFRWGWHL